MTVKELITKLQQADPDGNAKVIIPYGYGWLEPTEIQSDLTPPNDCLVLFFTPKVFINNEYHEW